MSTYKISGQNKLNLKHHLRSHHDNFCGICRSRHFASGSYVNSLAMELVIGTFGKSHMC